MIERHQDIKQYLAQLNEASWHNPKFGEDRIYARDLRFSQDYYYAQMSLLLKQQYQQSNRQIESILNIPRGKVSILTRKFDLDFKSIDAVMEAANKDGKNG